MPAQELLFKKGSVFLKKNFHLLKTVFKMPCSFLEFGQKLPSKIKMSEEISSFEVLDVLC
jgi:hypothetical protein